MGRPPKPPRSWKRRLLGLALRLPIYYLVFVLVMYFLENYLVFPGTPAARGWEPPPDPRVQDIELRSADGTRLHAWWYPRDGADGALLYSHGNGGNLSQRGYFVEALRNTLNQSVLIYDYPGYGKSEGAPTEAGCYAAADAAYDWLIQTQHVAPEDLILFGKSLGGGVAVDLAARRPHRALVLVKTFTSLPDAGQSIYPWLPVHLLMRNQFDSVSKIGKCNRPVFVAHGTADHIIPYALGERLFAAANEPKRFLSLSGVDHNDPLDDRFLFPLRDFLNEHAPARN